MSSLSIQSRILFITSEVTFFPSSSGRKSEYINSRSEFDPLSRLDDWFDSSHSQGLWDSLYFYLSKSRDR
jgi:hypothetical protein